MFDLKATTDWFFDRAAVAEKLDPAVRRALSKFGAYVRRRAQTSIRPRKGTSRPGQPPHSHAGLLRKFIFFSYDRASESVVIGPTLLKPDSTAPAALEYGSETHAARPYMRPAYEAELPKVPDLFRDMIK